MSFPLLVHPLLIHIILLMPTVYSAPKIGGILFEPILFEAYESDEKTTKTGKSQTETALSESTKETTLLDNATIRSSKETINTKTSPSQSTQETTFTDTVVTSINLKEIIELLRSNVKKEDSSEELGYFVTLASSKRSALISKLISTKTVSSPISLKITNSVVTNSEVTNSEVTNSETTNSKVTNVELTKSEVTNSKVTASEIIRPDNDQITVTLNSTQNTRKLFAHQQKVTEPAALRQNNRFHDKEVNTTLLNLLTYGYEFDDRICRIVDNRVLCGYNTNPQLAKGIQTMETGNGCRVRGDRIECGYVDPPFSNLRRPPPAPNAGTKIGGETEIKYRNLDRKVYNNDPPKIQKLKGSDSSSPSQVVPTATFTTDSSSVIIDSSKTTSIPTSQSTLIKKLKKQHCVEKDDRIVCYDVKE